MASPCRQRVFVGRRIARIGVVAALLLSPVICIAQVAAAARVPGAWVTEANGVQTTPRSIPEMNGAQTTPQSIPEMNGPRISQPPAPEMNGTKALEYIRAQLAFGPRVPGTAAAEQTGDWIAAHMRERADTVIEQRWTHTTNQGVALPMRNILGRFLPGAEKRILYVAHWDSRPNADGDRERARRNEPVPGANDGASGVALLMAIADALALRAPGIGVDLLFVDGEDYGSFSYERDVLIGSKYFAANLPEPGYRPEFGVVWDMIGDAQLEIAREGHSTQHAREVVDHVWSHAAALGYAKHFTSRAGHTLLDDHVPLQRAGLRVIVVIDFDYEWHHTTGDTIERVSASSLQVVGDVAIRLVRAGGGQGG